MFEFLHKNGEYLFEGRNGLRVECELPDEAKHHQIFIVFQIRFFCWLLKEREAVCLWQVVGERLHRGDVEGGGMKWVCLGRNLRKHMFVGSFI